MTNTILTLLSRERLNRHYAAGHWRNETLYDLVKRHAEGDPERIAVRTSRAMLSYADLTARADSLAADLLAGGVRPGQRIAVWLPSRCEAAIALVACSRAGFVCCLSLHRDHTVAAVAGLCERMGAAAFIGEKGYGADSAQRSIFDSLRRSTSLRRIYELDVPGTGLDPTLPDESTLAGNLPPKADPNLILYLAFTSGSTGEPKGVMHSDNTILANARALIADWHFDAGSVIYSLSPLSHNLGLGSLTMALAAGSEFVVHDLPRGASLLDRLTAVGATFLVGVPTHAIDLLDEVRNSGSRPPASLKGFRISGASAPREVVAELLRSGIVPQSGYGMTEAGSHHYTLPTDGTDRVVNTSGRACPGYEVRIWSKDDPDVECAVGEVGQIGGRGASLMLGYFGDQGANERAFNASGWFMSGDMGRLDADGYLQITGRKKELIIRGGHNIYPAQIENLTMQHSSVARAAALPVPDDRLGEKVCLVVMFRPGLRVGVDDLLVYLDQCGLSRYDMPEYFLEVEQIPLTASGKLLKRDLGAGLMDGRLKPTPIRWQAPAQAPERVASAG